MAASLPQTQPTTSAQHAPAASLTSVTQPGRRLRPLRLVRRRKEIGRRSLALLLQTCGVGFTRLGLICVSYAVMFLAMWAWYCLTPHHDAASDLPERITVVRIGVERGTLALIGIVLYQLGQSANKRAAVLHDIFLTSANTADLPAPDSLVRASSEPMQAQEAVLLRAAAEGPQTPPEQLMRASVGQE